MFPPSSNNLTFSYMRKTQNKGVTLAFAGIESLGRIFASLGELNFTFR